MFEKILKEGDFKGIPHNMRPLLRSFWMILVWFCKALTPATSGCCLDENERQCCHQYDSCDNSHRHRCCLAIDWLVFAWVADYFIMRERDQGQHFSSFMYLFFVPLVIVNIEKHNKGMSKIRQNTPKMEDRPFNNQDLVPKIAVLVRVKCSKKRKI